MVISRRLWKYRPTQRAPDGWWAPRFELGSREKLGSVSLAGSPQPPVTQAVGRGIEVIQDKSKERMLFYMIRELHPDDLPTCADLLVDAYNDDPWNYHWTVETATRYLNEYVASENFVGFVICEDTTIVGAMFAHRKTWWTKDELFVDEVYIAPQCQRQGYGAKLLGHAECYAKEAGLAGLTLLTDRHMPAAAFYFKHGYLQAEHVVFMYKVV